MGSLSKFVMCILGILVLTQILFYNVLQSQNLKNARHEKKRFAAEIQRLVNEKIASHQKLAVLQEEYELIATGVPAEILTGYEDHEVMLASFLDYIKEPAFKKVDAKVSLQGVQKFVEQPVPVFENDINFTFSFRRLADAESFLELILGQNYYPLVVRDIELHNTGQEKISGTLHTSFLIPAKQKNPFFKTRDES
jgi:hypothetical protein